MRCRLDRSCSKPKAYAACSGIIAAGSLPVRQLTTRERLQDTARATAVVTHVPRSPRSLCPYPETMKQNRLRLLRKHKRIIAEFATYFTLAVAFSVREPSKDPTQHRFA